MVHVLVLGKTLCMEVTVIADGLWKPMGGRLHTHVQNMRKLAKSSLLKKQEAF